MAETEPRLSRKPVAPYMAVGLSTYVYGIAERKHIAVNLDTIEDNIHAAMSMVNINMPVKLIALSEGALTGFTDEAFDLPHKLAARDLFIDIPGPESERLAGLARLYETYIIVQMQGALARGHRRPLLQHDVRHLAEPARSCTRRRRTISGVGNAPARRTTSTIAGWSCIGDGIEAFYPVLRTDDIGNIGTICCSDGEYPEVGAGPRVERGRGRLPAERGDADDG